MILVPAGAVRLRDCDCGGVSTAHVGLPGSVGYSERCRTPITLSFVLQKWSYASLPVKIFVVLASSVPLVVAFGLAYYAAVGGRAAGQDLREALIKIHCILNRMPGTNMVGTGVRWARSRGALLRLEWGMNGRAALRVPGREP